VWTGTKMIVWGGKNDTIYTNTGGRYDPTTDAWTGTQISNAPTARVWHTAVWTGTEMIVWGGYNGTFYLINGGRYNPTTDVWAVSTTTGAPMGRTSHTAVWTGTEMIVWGGYNGSIGSDLNTGGRYNPSTGAWAATSTAGAPSTRNSHTAVWTGTAMIVWGGNNSPIGGLYCNGSCEAPNVFYQDADGDQFGSPAVSVPACTQPAGYASNALDCNDVDPTVNPAASEACNGIDDDCDGATDESAGAGLVSAVSASKSGSTASFAWAATPGATTYDVLRGHAGVFPVGSNPGTETCLGDNLAVATVSDAGVPAVYADQAAWKSCFESRSKVVTTIEGRRWV